MAGEASCLMTLASCCSALQYDILQNLSLRSARIFVLIAALVVHLSSLTAGLGCDDDTPLNVLGGNGAKRQLQWSLIEPTRG